MAGDTERVQDYELTTSASLVDIEAEDSPLPQVRPDSVQRTSDGREEGWDDETVMYANVQGEHKKEIRLWKLGLLSAVNAGTGFGWALQLSLLTPYIQMLGVTHEFSSLVWLCGPIAGLVVQPIVGVWTDRCTSKWGRRRPYIGIGVLLIMFSVTMIGFAADMGSILGDSHEDCHDFQGKRPRAASVVIAGFWLLDIAANMVHPPLLALLADLSGPGQRVSANAIYCLWGSLGGVLGYAAGSYAHWYEVFPFLVSKACCAPCANLKAAFLLQIAFLAICTIITMVLGDETPLNMVVVKEQQLAVEPVRRDIGDDQGTHCKPHDDDHAPLLVDELSNDANIHHDLMMQIPVDNLHPQNGHVATDHQEEEAGHNYHVFVKGLSSSLCTHSIVGSIRGSLCSLFVSLLRGVRKLPKSMTYVLVVMALSWFSWFPFLLYDTDWMGREVYQGDPDGNITQVAAYQRGVEKGAFGLLLNSVVSLISSLFIDFLCQMLGSKNVWAVANFILFAALACTGLITRSAAGGHEWSRSAAVALFAVLGFPFAILLSVPNSMTMELIADSGGGQGLAIGILNLAVVIPQMIVTLGAGPWDAWFGGGNEPAFVLAALFGFGAAVVAVWKLPKMSGTMHTRRVCNEWAALI